MINVVFVCLGNICRSPTAQGVFSALVSERGLTDRIGVDSAGTGAWHIGDQPDPRAQAAARGRGIDLSTQRSRQITTNDFEAFDYVLAMDRRNHADLSAIAPSARRDRIHLFLSFAPQTGVLEVPDPYYGGTDGFDHVLDLTLAASRGLLDDIQKKHLAKKASGG